PIVHALISLGAELEVEVIAEGVETSAQFQLLTELGCQQVQGYLFARPASAVQAQLALRRSWGGLAKSARNSHAALATLENWAASTSPCLASPRQRASSLRAPGCWAPLVAALMGGQKKNVVP